MAMACSKGLTAIITVNWRAGGLTCKMLDSLAQMPCRDWFAVVCENGSADDSPSVLRAHLAAQYDETARPLAGDGTDRVFDYTHRNTASPSLAVTLVVSERNLGFAGGNNLALRYVYPSAQPSAYWFLNNDTEVEPDCLSHLLNKLALSPEIGMCGATLVYEHARNQVQAFGGARYFPMTGHVREIGQGQHWPQAVDEFAIEAQLDYVAGASMFVRGSFLDAVGPMSEDYFLYFEEIDWALRGRAKGFVLGYASKAVVYHKEGAVLGSGKGARRSLLAEYYALRNRLRLTKKFYPAALPTVFLFCWLQVLRRLVQRRWVAARLMSSVLLGMRKVAP